MPRVPSGKRCVHLEPPVWLPVMTSNLRWTLSCGACFAQTILVMLMMIACCMMMMTMLIILTLMLMMMQTLDSDVDIDGLPLICTIKTRDSRIQQKCQRQHAVSYMHDQLLCCSVN